MSARHFEGVAHAAIYAKFRPIPPAILTNKITEYVKEQLSGPYNIAVDVGCGSGQSTRFLSSSFANVVGLDISNAQIKEATKNETSRNITYKVSSAEELPFANSSVSLITAGQACHWFDLPKFYKEVDRILVQNGVLALYGYNFPRPIYGNKSEQLFEILQKVYLKDTAGLWGKERKYVDEHYTDKKFIIPMKDFSRIDSYYYENDMTVAGLRGYLSSWSGYVKYRDVNGEDAATKLLDTFQDDIMSTMETKGSPSETKIKMRYPYFLLLARKNLSS